MYEIRFDERGVCAMGSMAGLSDKELKRIRFSLLAMAGKIQNFIVERGGELQAQTPLITPEILLKNGWIETADIMVLKTSTIRLGWKPENGTFIIGYGQLPRPITEVGELMDIYRLCGLYELANKFIL